MEGVADSLHFPACFWGLLEAAERAGLRRMIGLRRFSPPSQRPSSRRERNRKCERRPDCLPKEETVEHLRQGFRWFVLVAGLGLGRGTFPKVFGTLCQPSYAADCVALACAARDVKSAVGRRGDGGSESPGFVPLPYASPRARKEEGSRRQAPDMSEVKHRWSRGSG